MVTDQDKAWMAGVIDLKGRITKKVNRARNTPQITLTVMSKALPVIRRLCELTGTSPEIHTARKLDLVRRNCVEHCPDQHVHVSAYDPLNPYAIKWTATGSAFLVVLHNLRPYLVVDHGYQEAETVLSANLALSGRGATAVFSSCNRMRTLGWALPDSIETALNDQFDRTLAALPS